MPTALELGPEGWKAYLRVTTDRPATNPEDRSHDSERQQLLMRVHKAAERIKAKYAPRRLVLFGSVAHQGWFMPDSDIDLAVEGLSGQDYWDAWKLAEEIILDRPVDFVDMETVGKSMRKAIDRYGMEL